MLNKIGRLISEFSIVKIVLVVLSILLFHIFFDKITQFVESNLILTGNISNFWLDLFILVLTVFFIIFFGIRFWYTNYKPSFSTLFIVFIFTYTTIHFLLQSDRIGWWFYRDSILKIYYVNYFLLLGLLILTYGLIVKLYSLVSVETTYLSRYLSDEPITQDSQDKLGYKRYVKDLSRILLHESFPKSFSVALVGPWGNGKSSVLDLVKNEIHRNELHRKSNIFIHFLPYLNHKEEDIINEFFVLLSNQLSKFDGKISNQIISYSQKITDLYQSKNLTDFVSKPLNSFNNNAAKELYKEINRSLVKINKKIIVFIDDLDRLSGNEIIQVLKLIRNTANFKNTIFVVAMDKDYVLQRLKSSDEILNSNYLEKFFQLEIYLPEIDKNILREYFLESFNDFKLDEASDFKKALSETLLDSNNLFDDYVRNLRDVKRLSNQVKFDYPYVKNEIDLTDFVNFTFLKTKFPNIINSLYRNRTSLLQFNKPTDTYSLELLEEESGTKKQLTAIDIILNVNTNITNDFEGFKKYKLFDKLISDEFCKDGMTKLDCEDGYLLMKTLKILFGSDKAKNSKSIQLQDNLNIILQRKIHENVFTENDYVKLISFENFEGLKKIVSELNRNNKLSQFLKKLQWFIPENKDELKKIIIILIHLYQVKKDYNLNGIEVDKRLAINARAFLNKEFGVQQENSEWLWSKVFVKNYLSLPKQIFFLGDLWDAQHENSLWGFEKEKITAEAIKLYKKYLKNIDNNLWAVDDFSFYGIYHAIKNIDGVQPELNKLFKEVWSQWDIKLLCAQTIQPAAFSSKAFNISDILIEIFDSKDGFVEFVKEHNSATDESIQEYIQFLELLQKTQFKIALDFRFEKFQLARKRIQEIELNYKKNTIYDELEGISQVLFETNDTDLFRRYAPYDNSEHHLFIVDHKEYSVMRANIKQKMFRKDLLELARNISNSPNDHNWIKDSFNQKELLKNETFLTYQNDEKKYIKIIHPLPLLSK